MCRLFISVVHAESGSGTTKRTNGDAVTHDIAKAGSQMNEAIRRESARNRGGNTGTQGRTRG